MANEVKSELMKKFESELDKRGEKMTERQSEIAAQLLGMPERGGKTWLINRLCAFELSRRTD